MKLSFRQTKEVPAGAPFYDDYDVTITEEGSPDTTICIRPDGGPPSIMSSGLLFCNALSGTYEYKLNFNNQRFIRIYTAGYVSGRDNNDDTPAISGGLCIKISQ